MASGSWSIRSWNSRISIYVSAWLKNSQKNMHDIWWNWFHDVLLPNKGKLYYFLNTHYLICLKECLNVWCIIRTKFHHFVLTWMTRVKGRCTIWHHAKDGQIVARLITLSAAFIFIIDNIFSNITVNVLVTAKIKKI